MLFLGCLNDNLITLFVNFSLGGRPMHCDDLFLGMMRFVTVMWTLLLGMPHMVPPMMMKLTVLTRESKLCKVVYSVGTK